MLCISYIWKIYNNKSDTEEGSTEKTYPKYKFKFIIQSYNKKMLEKKRIYFDTNYSRKNHNISLKKQSRKLGKITNNTIANVNSSQQQEIACFNNLTENGIRYKKFLPRSILYSVTKHNQEKNLRL